MDNKYYEKQDCSYCQQIGCTRCGGYGYILILVPSDRTDIELRHALKMRTAALELANLTNKQLQSQLSEMANVCDSLTSSLTDLREDGTFWLRVTLADKEKINGFLSNYNKSQEGGNNAKG